MSIPRAGLAGLSLAALLGSGLAALPAQAQIQVGHTLFGTPELVGVGRLAANLRDEHGETFGSISGLVADLSSWTRSGNSYSGVFYASPDRGHTTAVSR